MSRSVYFGSVYFHYYVNKTILFGILEISKYNDCPEYKV